MIVTIVQLADLPADGQPWAALETAHPGSTFVKANNYDAVDLAIQSTGSSGDFAVYRYNQDFKGWYPEGPRGTTPTTFGQSLPNNIPIRISCPLVESILCVVQTNGDPAEDLVASLVGVNR